MPKKKYKEGFYWVIPPKTVFNLNPEPEIVHFENDSEGGRFVRYNGQWGTDYAYTILKGPLVYEP